ILRSAPPSMVKMPRSAGASGTTSSLALMRFGVRFVTVNGIEPLRSTLRGMMSLGRVISNVGIPFSLLFLWLLWLRTKLYAIARDVGGVLPLDDSSNQSSL